MKMQDALNVAVIYGSVRPGRLGIRAARFMVAQCRARGHAVELIDPLDYPLPLLERKYKDYPEGAAPAAMGQVAAHLTAADAYLVIAGEYNHTVPPALSNLLDHYLEEYFRKPSGIVCYSAGAFGGVRAAMTLRAMLAELGTSSIPSLFPVPRVQDAFDEQGVPADERAVARAARFLDELEWYAHAMKAQRGRDCARSECDGSALTGTSG
jgi:NAD(P)H-dependent FMN reductase